MPAHDRAAGQPGSRAATPAATTERGVRAANARTPRSRCGAPYYLTEGPTLTVIVWPFFGSLTIEILVLVSGTWTPAVGFSSNQ